MYKLGRCRGLHDPGEDVTKYTDHFGNVGAWTGLVAGLILLCTVEI